MLANRDNFRELGVGGAQPNISKEKIVRTVIPLPPLAEQHRIVKRVQELLPLCDDLEKDEKSLQNLIAAFPSMMKNSVLQAAVEGKLTEQLPEDGDARDLLAQIRAEKEQLVKDKKLKREKPLPPITEAEIPFQIPPTWQWVRLGDYTSFRIGKTPSRSNASYWGQGIPWVSIRDMTQGEPVVSTKEQITSKAFKEAFNETIVPKNTLLMSFKLTIGRCCLTSVDAVHNEAIISIFPYETSEIAKLYLLSILPLVSKLGDSKGAIKGNTLNSHSLRNLTIPLPPLAEQYRIVARLNELLPLCEPNN